MPINNRDSGRRAGFWIRKVADQVNQAENNHSRWITLETKQVKEFLSMVGDCTEAAECRYFVERNAESKFIGMSQFDWKVTDRLTGADVAYSHMQSIADQLAAILNREAGEHAEP